jgi:hypothetical protein
MTRTKAAILLLSVMPLYLAPALSMHICIGQAHHHGNCDGEMTKESEQAEAPTSAPLDFQEASHLHCFQLEKNTSPCIGCKGHLSAQQLALLISPNQGILPAKPGFANHTPYHPPPRKSPLPEDHQIRPPPFTSV